MLPHDVKFVLFSNDLVVFLFDTYMITQVNLAFWLVLTYDLLEDRCTNYDFSASQNLKGFCETTTEPQNIFLELRKERNQC